MDAGFDAFQVSIGPLMAALVAGAWLWEAAGRRPTDLGYALAAAGIAFAMLESFFLFAYGAPPSLELDLAEAALLVSFAAAGGAFSFMRRMMRSVWPNQ
ncbi:MAG: hypothetical protein GC152_04040 [Alphaproteobacteria bacterium]|nr:hypothetical protein [Alphaproteobacteria bacterium]